MIAVPFAYIRAGDWAVLLAAALLVAWLAATAWQGDAADRAIIRSGGKIFREVPLSRDQQIEVPGPLGTSIISIEKGKARISSDPSPRQYCVRQGWLRQAGEIAVCLPNQISLELAGGSKRYDSLNY